MNEEFEKWVNTIDPKKDEWVQDLQTGLRVPYHRWGHGGFSYSQTNGRIMREEKTPTTDWAISIPSKYHDMGLQFPILTPFWGVRTATMYGVLPSLDSLKQFAKSEGLMLFKSDLCDPQVNNPYPGMFRHILHGENYLVTTPDGKVVGIVSPDLKIWHDECGINHKCQAKLGALPRSLHTQVDNLSKVKGWVSTSEMLEAGIRAPNYQTTLNSKVLNEYLWQYGYSRYSKNLIAWANQNGEIILVLVSYWEHHGWLKPILYINKEGMEMLKLKGVKIVVLRKKKGFGLFSGEED